MKLKKILPVAIFIVLICMLINVKSFATVAKERTETLNLTTTDFATDQSNVEEGWSWVAATNTLTLNNVNFNTGSNSSIIVDGLKNVTFILEGTNTLTSSTTTVTRNNTASADAGLTISGSGELTVTHTGNLVTFDQSNFTMKSGTLNVIGGSIASVYSIKIEGGTLNVDTSKVSDAGWPDGLYGCASIEISGGKVDINSNRIALYNTGTARPEPATGVSITGGDITLYGPLCDIYAGQDNPKNIYIKTNGTIDFKNSLRGIYSSHGNTTIESGTFKTSQLTNIFLLGKDNKSAVVNIATADYSKVNTQIARIPADLSVYVESTVTDVNTAKNAVITSKNILEQEKVDEYAKNLKTAIDNLKYKPANYTDVTKAKSEIPADLSLYTDDSVQNLQDVLASIDYNKNITEQSDVDNYVTPIRDAINNLVYKDADYSDESLAESEIPADLSLYTDDSVQNLQAVLDSIDYTLNILDQYIVDDYANSIRDAINNLVYKDADYSRVFDLISNAPSDLSLFTEKSAKDLLDAINAVQYKKNISQQDEVNIYADNIENALNNLELLKLKSDNIIVEMENNSKGFDPSTVLKVIKLNLNDSQKEQYNIKITGLLNNKKIINLFDISMYIENEKITNFNGNIVIYIPLGDDYADYTDLNVVYIAPDGTITKIDSVIEGNFIKLTTNHLSNYAIVGEKIIKNTENQDNTQQPTEIANVSKLNNSKVLHNTAKTGDNIFTYILTILVIFIINLLFSLILKKRNK